MLSKCKWSQERENGCNKGRRSRGGAKGTIEGGKERKVQQAQMERRVIKERGGSEWRDGEQSGQNIYIQT